MRNFLYVEYAVLATREVTASVHLLRCTTVFLAGFGDKRRVYDFNESRSKHATVLDRCHRYYGPGQFSVLPPRTQLRKDYGTPDRVSFPPHAVEGTQEHNRDSLSNSFSELSSVEIAIIYFLIMCT